MNITAEILFFLFSKKHRISFQQILRYEQPLRGIRLYDLKAAPERDYLYVLSEGSFHRLSPEERKRFSFLFVAAPEKTVPDEDGPDGLKKLNLAVTEDFPDPGSLFYALQEQFQTLLEQENELLLATMAARSGSDIVFSYGARWFPWEYSIVDIDMRLIYRTDNLSRVTGSGNVERVPAESIRELILNREFHEAAKKQAVFYQSVPSSGLTVIAKNILPDGQYAGRVVMYLDEAMQKAPRGAEELFEFFTDCIMETLSRSGHFTSRIQNDPLHLLCRSLFQGEKPSAHAIDDVFGRIRWKRSHFFSVITLRFLPDTAWQAQLETTLPYLADELESEWPDSCAVNSGTEIYWVLNVSLSGAGNLQESFHQKVTHFVREHLCIAGASPVFRDFSLLSDAKKSATAALEIGHQKNPHIWFFSFDDYRLDYIKDELRSALPAALLRHPALRTLEEYDRKNHAELSGTLYAFLQNGRNMSAAADAIFIHRTTFCRRMDQIRKITGLDLDDLSTVIQLELSYQLQE